MEIRVLLLCLTFCAIVHGQANCMDLDDEYTEDLQQMVLLPTSTPYEPGLYWQEIPIIAEAQNRLKRPVNVNHCRETKEQFDLAPIMKNIITEAHQDLLSILSKQPLTLREFLALFTESVAQKFNLFLAQNQQLNQVLTQQDQRRPQLT